MKEMSLSSASAQRQSDGIAKLKPSISIIVPVLNEGGRIQRFLEHLRERAPSAELILVNAAGSESGPESVAQLCDVVLTGRRGRAAQMNAGANVAGGQVLWFVSGGFEVARGWLEEIAHTPPGRQVVG